MSSVDKKDFLGHLKKSTGKPPASQKKVKWWSMTQCEVEGAVVMRLYRVLTSPGLFHHLYFRELAIIMSGQQFTRQKK